MAMLEHVDFRNARVLVELGCGTGVITHHIVRRMAPDARLIALDVNDRFVRYLRGTCLDGRVTILQGDASDLRTHLRLQRAEIAHAVISSVGLTNMSAEERARMIVAVKACLSASGVLTQQQYLNPVYPLLHLPLRTVWPFEAKRFLTSHFRRVEVKRVLFNLPPAQVFTCQR